MWGLEREKVGSWQRCKQKLAGEGKWQRFKSAARNSFPVDNKFERRIQAHYIQRYEDLAFTRVEGSEHFLGSSVEGIMYAGWVLSIEQLNKVELELEKHQDTDFIHRGVVDFESFMFEFQYETNDFPLFFIRVPF